MWDEERELRGALRAELAQQQPPARSGLADVIPRGRRRRRARQLGAAVAVVAIVTGTGAAITTLRDAGAPDELTAAGAGPTSATTADWPKADLPARTPYATWSPGPTAPPPPSRKILNTPRCDIGDTSTRRESVGQGSQHLLQRLISAARDAAGSAVVADPVMRMMPANPEKVGSVDGYDYTADVTDANGTGSMRFTVGTFTGDPVAAADEQAFDLFNCDPPKRTVLASGTVLQVYPVLPSEPFQSLTQTLRIFLPGGTLYQLEVHNFGSPDFEPNPAQPEYPNRVGPGRETLPLTEAQLAAIGLAVAETG
jgi:hypothetical protein